MAAATKVSSSLGRVRAMLDLTGGIRRLASTGHGGKRPRVAVVLSGCGVFDGTEIHEAAACFSALTRNGASPIPFAPAVRQAHIIDHFTGSASNDPGSRCALAESARIARGAISPLSELHGGDPEMAAVIFPGGFGVAKNLSDFAFCGGGDKMVVNPDVARVIQEFRQAGKPMAFCCIAPILAAKMVPGATLTMGKQGAESDWPHGGAIEAARAMGGNMVEMGVDGVAVDTANKIVSTPAFMYNGQFHEIHDGVSKMVVELLKLLGD